VLPLGPSARQSDISKWFSSVAGNGFVDCDTVGDYVESGQWVDPNKGHVYLRQVKTKPHFHVSVHNKEYDVVRWEHIFEKGDYYEHKVRKNFEYILGETNAHWKSSIDHANTLPIVVDIGGNIGYFTLLSAAWKHAVVTFEINPTNVMRLCESVKFNREEMHVRIHRMGASNITGSTFEIEVQPNPGATGLEKGSKQAVSSNHVTTERKFTITTITLDDFATERKWFERDDLYISLLKLDTEGHEPQILQGAEKFFKHRLAKNLMLEYRTKSRDAATMLFDAGYVIVDDDANPHRILSRKESEARVDSLAVKNHYTDLWFRRSDMPLRGK